MGTLLYFLIFAALFAFMMRFGCGSHVMGHHGHDGAHGGARQPAPGTAVDPVCGMTVETAKAMSGVHAGVTYYFCSKSCRDKFEAAPGKYIKAAAGAPAAGSHSHG